jgi:hypothetical protein
MKNGHRNGAATGVTSNGADRPLRPVSPAAGSLHAAGEAAFTLTRPELEALHEVLRLEHFGDPVVREIVERMGRARHG